jgi:succinate dehydrogenase/fumarate reductase cytochrome b subunit
LRVKPIAGEAHTENAEDEPGTVAKFESGGKHRHSLRGHSTLGIGGTTDDKIRSLSDVMLVKALILLIPASLLFAYSLLLFQRKARGSMLQLLGATSLLVVVFTHICEALRLFPAMGWGAEHSPGHYLDLATAVFGLTLFPAGYLIRIRKRHV